MCRHRPHERLHHHARGLCFFCGSEFALEGISEAPGKEVAGFGIRVAALAPGQFRTDWVGRCMDRTPRSIADYNAVMDPIRAARQANSGNQPGDPAKAARALLALVEAPNPPVWLFLGDDALGLIEQQKFRPAVTCTSCSPNKRTCVCAPFRC